MKETKADAIDAAPIQIHHEVAPYSVTRSEASEELVGMRREPYGPGGMSFIIFIWLFCASGGHWLM